MPHELAHAGLLAHAHEGERGRKGGAMGQDKGDGYRTAHDLRARLEQGERALMLPAAECTPVHAQRDERELGGKERGGQSEAGGDRWNRSSRSSAAIYSGAPWAKCRDAQECRGRRTQAHVNQTSRSSRSACAAACPRPYPPSLLWNAGTNRSIRPCTRWAWIAPVRQFGTRDVVSAVSPIANASHVAVFGVRTSLLPTRACSRRFQTAVDD